MLQAQTFWLLVAAEAGSTLLKLISLKAVSCARLGTLAVIVTLPVDVAPRDPCDAAIAGVPSANAAAEASATAAMLRLRRVRREANILATPGSFLVGMKNSAMPRRPTARTHPCGVSPSDGDREVARQVLMGPERPSGVNEFL